MSQPPERLWSLMTAKKFGSLPTVRTIANSAFSCES